MRNKIEIENENIKKYFLGNQEMRSSVAYLVQK
jgi:hypothetical protein